MDDVYIRLLSLERRANSLDRLWVKVDSLQLKMESATRASILAVGSNTPITPGGPPPQPPPSGTPSPPPTTGTPHPPPPGLPPGSGLGGVSVCIPSGFSLASGQCFWVIDKYICNDTASTIVGGQGPGGTCTPVSAVPYLDGKWHIPAPPAGVIQIIPGLNPFFTPSIGVPALSCYRVYPNGFLELSDTLYAGNGPPQFSGPDVPGTYVICNPYFHSIPGNIVVVLRRGSDGVLLIEGADCPQEQTLSGPCNQPGTVGVVTVDTSGAVLCNQCSNGFTNVIVLDPIYGSTNLTWDAANTRFIGNATILVTGVRDAFHNPVPYAAYKTGPDGCPACNYAIQQNTQVTYILTYASSTLTLTAWYPTCTSAGACTGFLAPSGGTYANSGANGTTGASVVGTVAIGTLVDGVNYRDFSNFGQSEPASSVAPWSYANAGCPTCTDPTWRGTDITLELATKTGGCLPYITGDWGGQCNGLLHQVLFTDSRYGSVILTYHIGSIWKGTLSSTVTCSSSDDISSRCNGSGGCSWNHSATIDFLITVTVTTSVNLLIQWLICNAGPCSAGPLSSCSETITLDAGDFQPTFGQASQNLGSTGTLNCSSLNVTYSATVSGFSAGCGAPWNTNHGGLSTVSVQVT